MNKPIRSASLRTPFRAPPSAALLAANGMELMKTKRVQAFEDGPSAYKRAMTMPWSERIADSWPFQSGGFWMWLCRKEAA